MAHTNEVLTNEIVGYIRRARWTSRTGETDEKTGQPKFSLSYKKIAEAVYNKFGISASTVGVEYAGRGITHSGVPFPDGMERYPLLHGPSVQRRIDRREEKKAERLAKQSEEKKPEQPTTPTPTARENAEAEGLENDHHVDEIVDDLVMGEIGDQTPEVKLNVSYKVDVIADHTGKWASNGKTFTTRQEAENYGQDLSCRWMSVREWRVVEVPETADVQTESVSTPESEQPNDSEPVSADVKGKPKVNGKLDDDDRKEIVARSQAGESAKVLALDFSVNPSTISRILAKAGTN